MSVHVARRVHERDEAVLVPVGADRCVGVSVVADGVQRDIRAGAEVILSAGAIDTPRLLMLSGIGPADELTDMGIDVAVDLPAAGRNLQDHTVTGLIYEARRTIPPGTSNHGEASVLSPRRSDAVGKGCRRARPPSWSRQTTSSAPPHPPPEDKADAASASS